MNSSIRLLALSLAALVGCGVTVTGERDASDIAVARDVLRDSAPAADTGGLQDAMLGSGDGGTSVDVSPVDSEPGDAYYVDAERSDATGVGTMDAPTGTSDTGTVIVADTGTPTGTDAGTGTRDSGSGPVPMPGEIVGIMSGHLVRGDARFMPRGLSLTGLALSPVAAAAAGAPAVFARAQTEIRTHLDTNLARYASWGVNTLRFQVSQDGLDPMSTVYDPTYLPFIIATVQRSRDAGFVVIISMRESMPGDYLDQCGPDKLPCAVTQRAWRQILTHPANIGSDRHFVLEIYNEPMAGVSNTDANWRLWRAPHQSLLDAIRGMGANNVLIADGIRAGKFLPATSSSAHRLSDPVGRLAYGIHPYPLFLSSISYYRSADWRPAFGTFCDDTVACIATEWATGSDVACFDPSTNPNGVNSANVATSLIRFLDAAHIGSVLWPGDYPGAIVSDWVGGLAVWGVWSTINCSDASQHRGMGAMMRAYYLSGTPP